MFSFKFSTSVIKSAILSIKDFFHLIHLLFRLLTVFLEFVLRCYVHMSQCLLHCEVRYLDVFLHPCYGFGQVTYLFRHAFSSFWFLFGGFRFACWFNIIAIILRHCSCHSFWSFWRPCWSPRSSCRSSSKIILRFDLRNDVADHNQNKNSFYHDLTEFLSRLLVQTS